LIDLHTHSTASDGRCSPSELVVRAAGNGVTILSVTDHDTVAGCPEAARACGKKSITFVPGVEVTAVWEGRDVHVLGYFVDITAPPLMEFLRTQRDRRIERVSAILERLAAHGVLLDAQRILEPAVQDPSKAAGRPWIARELVAAGHATDVSEAFDRWLSPGRPAFVPRTGAQPRDVIAHLHRAGGIASLAHPGLLARDAWIDGFAADGLDALEAYHTRHTPEETERYLAVAERLDLLVSGGSDFHADTAHPAAAPGDVVLPPDAFERLRDRYERRLATSRARASDPSISS
jgi:predicted metal-dependent phosphoesterase TrpH